LRVVPVLVLIGSNSPSQVPNQSHGRDYDVLVERAIKVNAGDSLVYAITASFQFKNRDSVFVKDLGLVPARSRYSYLASSRTIEFREADSGRLIVSVPVEETVQVATATAPRLDFPRESDFPSAFRTYAVSASATKLRDVVYQTLQASFQIEPRDDNHLTRVTTSYQSLPMRNGPRNITGQIALRVSFPFDESTGQLHYRVQQSIREGRSSSDDWRQPTTAEVIQAADSFVQNLVESLNAGLK